MTVHPKKKKKKKKHPHCQPEKCVNSIFSDLHFCNITLPKQSKSWSFLQLWAAWPHEPILPKRLYAQSLCAPANLQLSGVQNVNENWTEIFHPSAKSLREILAPSLRDHSARSTFQTEFARPCPKMSSRDLVHFCLRDAGTKLISDLGFLVSQILGSLGCFSASRLLGLSGGLSTSRFQSTQFLFCRQRNPWMPPVSAWPWARVQSVQWHGSQSVQWFCLVSRSETG